MGIKRFLFVSIACAGIMSRVAFGSTAPADSDWRPASGALSEGSEDASVVVRALSAEPDTQRLQFKFPESLLQRGADGVYDVLIPSAQRGGEPGEPMLPLVTTRIAIPQGHEVVSVTVTPSQGVEHVLDAPVRHARQPYPLSRPQDRRETLPLASIYGADTPFPASLQSPFSVQTKRGVSIVQLTLFPVVYRPLSGRLTSYTSLSVDVTTRLVVETLGVMSTSEVSWRATYRSDADGAAVAGMLENPSIIDQYEPDTPISVDEKAVSVSLSAAGSPPGLPCRAADNYRHVIITTRELNDAKIVVGWAMAQTNEAGEAFLFLGAETGSPWAEGGADLAAFLTDASTAGGEPAPATNATETEKQYIQREFYNLPDPSDETYAIKFGIATNDVDTNGVPDWLELLDGAVLSPPAERKHFELTELAATNTFEDIVAIRESQGMSSVVVLLSSILDVYNGVDDAEAVRLFIRDAYDKWGTEYVMLGGDASVMPIRSMSFAYYGADYIPWDGRDVPSDLYFQCLDGSFNSDNDDFWGEATDGGDRLDGRPGEDIDLYAELAVGRLPVRTGAGVTNWVARQLLYERDRLSGVELPYQTGALMVGEEVGQDLGFPWTYWYAEPSLEEIRLGSSMHGYSTVGFADSLTYTNLVTLYDSPTNTWTTDDLVGLINSNAYSLINHLGHSEYYLNMKLRSGEPTELFTNEKPLFEYSQGSWAGAFDTNCIAAEFIAAAPHGMFGGVFNSRYGWSVAGSTDGPSQRYARWFWNGFFAERVPVTGLLNQDAHERNAARINESYMRYVYYESNLLGDPAQWLAGVQAYIKLDREAYGSDGSPVVEILWPGANLSQSSVEVTVETRDALSNLIATTNVTCSLVGPVGFTALYQSDLISLAPLAATNGGTVYVSALLPDASGLALNSDEADIDDVPPQVLNRRVTQVDDSWVEVAWETDVPARSSARIGSTIGLNSEWEAVSTELVTNHVHRFERLDPFTFYHIAVRSEDDVGNEAMLPADPLSIVAGEYLTFFTVGRETASRFDETTYFDGWATTNLSGNACWQYGQPEGYGPVGAPRCWGTIADGRYPDGAHAQLTSPPITVREAPVLLFSHWHAIQYSGDMLGVSPSPPPYGDYGQVEVLRGGVWENVTQYADVADGKHYISGNSDGWEHVRVELPRYFGEQTLAVRFRFVSDQQQFFDGNPAGWYVSGVQVLDVPSSGMGISGCDVDDSVGGNGDGFAEPGETVSLRPSMFNYGSASSGVLTGSVVVLTVGNSSDNAALPDGAPASISYATVLPGEGVPADEPFRVALSTNIPVGSVLTLMQTVVTSAGTTIQSTYDLVLASAGEISGTVTDASTGLPVGGATVAASSVHRNLVTTSQPDGSYIFYGASPDTTYWLTASLLGIYTPQKRVVVAPAAGFDFSMGRSIASVTPRSLAFDMLAGGAETQSLTISNAVTAAEILEAVAQITYEQSVEGWLSLAPSPIALNPGESGAMAVTANTEGLLPGTYSAFITLALSDPQLPEVVIPVNILVRREPELIYAGVVIENDGNDNGALDTGESADMWVRLRNLDDFSGAVGVQGTLTSLTNVVTVNGPNELWWDYVPTYGSELSTNSVNLSLATGVADGAVLDFELALEWSDGADMVTNVLTFSYVHRFCTELSGVVETVVWIGESTNAVERYSVDTNAAPVAVTGAVVRAEDAQGNVYYSQPTDANGIYTVEAVPYGDTWLSVTPPEGSFVVAPAGSNLVVNTDPQVQDFLLGNHGETNTPLLKWSSFSVSDYYYGDGDGAIDPGEELSVTVYVNNYEGTLGAEQVTGFLEPADMGALGPYMTVPGDSGGTNDIPVGSYGYFYFSVTVNTNALPGDTQRFWVTTTEPLEEGGPRVWPFDFSLTVDPLYSVTGTVRRENGDPEPAVQMALTYDEGGGSTTVTSFDGSYYFDRLPAGISNLTVTPSVPEGYYVEPPSHVVDLLDRDISGLDFVLKESLITVSPTNLTATIFEDVLTNASFTVQNGMTNNSIDAEVRLDFGGAIGAIGGDWLALSTNFVALAPTNIAEVQVTFNPETNTPAGVYEADIVVDSDHGVRRLPVTLTVLDYSRAEVVDVRLVSDDDADGYAEPGESVSFEIVLRNTGSGLLASLNGTLVAVTTNVTVTEASSSWANLFGGETGESETVFAVTLPADVPAETLFDLMLTADDSPPQRLRVVLPTVLRESIAGRVISADGVAVTNSIVECYGTMGSRTVTDGNGDYLLSGLLVGDYDVRAIPETYTRATQLGVTVASAVSNVDLVVSAPDLSVLPAVLEAVLVRGTSSLTNLVVSNEASGDAANAYAFDVELMARRRIGLFDDGDRLGVLVEPLTQMGFEVDLYTNNFEVRYTKDTAVVFAYDLVIADLTGPDGSGRLFSDEESEVFVNYTDRGGYVIFTGGNPLSLPDNEGMGALCGVGLDRAMAPTNGVVSVSAWDGAFVQVAAGDTLASRNWTYDLATPVTGVAVETLFTAGHANKVTRREGVGDWGMGMACLWSGNPDAADWGEEGVWLDVLRDMLRHAFFQAAGPSADPSWLDVSPVSGTAPIAGAETLAVRFDTALLGTEDYRAVIVLRGLERGEEVRAIPVTLTVLPRMLRAFTSGSVTDWRDVPLRGDGGLSSAMYQVIDAGPDGEPGLPNLETGVPAGDDMLLATYPAGTVIGRMGDGGVPPDAGKFDQLLANPFPVNTSNAWVYVRAWENSTFDSSIAYGDSGVSNALESIDFGSWSITNIVDVNRNSNSNSLPDSWIIEHRPELDPRAPLAPLGISYEITRDEALPKVEANEPAPQPYRVVLSESNRFAFALDYANNRIVVIPADEHAAHSLYGSNGTGSGEFKSPEGMAADLRAGEYRLAVADTQNHRVQLFTYDPLTGALTHERIIGSSSSGSGVGQLDKPSAVAFDDDGNIYVADTGNSRIAIFRASDGIWRGAFDGSNNGKTLLSPRGLCVDPASDVVWVCDTGNHRLLRFSLGGIYQKTVGEEGEDPGQFVFPVDVQLWYTGSRRRLVVADKVNNRVQIFSSTGDYLAALGGLSLPNGVAPVEEQPQIVVADTANGRIVWMDVTLDVDQDGMDDIWEDQHQLDSTLFDAYADKDHDGLSNWTEYLIGTDPSKADTTGNGETDGEAVEAGRDPLADYEPPPKFYITAVLIAPYQLRWESEAAFTYAVETNASPVPVGWGVYTNVPGSATGENVLELPPVSGVRFFRVKRIGEL